MAEGDSPSRGHDLLQAPPPPLSTDLCDPSELRHSRSHCLPHSHSTCQPWSSPFVHPFLVPHRSLGSLHGALWSCRSRGFCCFARDLVMVVGFFFSVSCLLYQSRSRDLFIGWEYCVLSHKETQTGDCQLVSEEPGNESSATETPEGNLSSQPRSPASPTM